MEKKLKRELDQEALTRIEESARTPKDFDTVTKWWNRLDSNRERRERRREQEMVYNWDSTLYAGSSGDFLDLIYSNPNEMHELIEDGYLSKLVKVLSFKQKDVLYMNGLRFLTITEIAFIKGQTIRNIRKIHTLMLDNVQSKMAIKLKERKENGVSITTTQYKFLRYYKPKGKTKSD